MSEHIAVQQTKQWLQQIIIELNFCPFAKKEFVNQTIDYQVSQAKKVKVALKELSEQCQYLTENEEIETTLIIFEQGFTNFLDFLALIEQAEQLLVEQAFEGFLQLAHFHPEYYFADSDYDDASNYTNRSPYPTLHLIREQSIEKVLSVYQQPEKIPENNIALARQKGSAYFNAILSSIKNL